MILLSVVSILISKEVWEQYQSKATSFKQSEKDITKAESIDAVFSLWPLKNMNYPANVPYQAYEQWKLDSDFKPTFGVSEWKTVIESVKLTESKANLRIDHSSIGTIHFEKLITKWGDCYKVSADLVNVKEPTQVFLQIEFSKDIEKDKIPDVIMVFYPEIIQWEHF